MNISINKSNIVERNIVDSDGNVLFSFQYNPTDLNTLAKFEDLVDKLQMPEPETIKQAVEMFDMAAAAIDDIFGTGVVAAVTMGTRDFDMLMPLIDDVAPTFEAVKKERAEKYKKYTANANRRKAASK